MHQHLAYFFFQEEDGIQDFHVTGVQTCALQISVRGSAGIARGCAQTERSTGLGTYSKARRSEERRVGKEWRARWSPCDAKKKGRREQIVREHHYHDRGTGPRHARRRRH